MLETTNALDIDAVEQHRELGCVELHVVLTPARMPEAPSLEALVPEHEATLVEGQDLRSVPTSRDEDEQIAAEWILACGYDESVQTWVTLSHVGRLREQQHPRVTRQPDHLADLIRRSSAVTRFTTRSSSIVDGSTTRT